MAKCEHGDLIEALLGSRGKKEQSGAIKALGQNERELKKAVTALERMSTGSDEYYLEEAVFALAKLDHEDVVSPLLKVLLHWHDDEDFMELVFLEALEEIKNPQVRAKAAKGLLEIAKQQDNPARVFAARALGKVGDASQFGFLFSCLREGDATMREAAAGALTDMNDLRTLGPLLRNFEKDYGAFDEPVGSMFVPVYEIDQDKEVLRKALHNKNEDEDVRLSAALVLSLEDFPNQTAIALLVDHLLHDDNWMVREFTAETLGKTKDLAALVGLIKALKDPHPKVVISAIYALSEFGDEAAVRPLIRLIECAEDEDIKISAARALGFLRSSEALGLLEQEREKRLAVVKPEDRRDDFQLEVLDDAIYRIKEKIALLSGIE